MWSLFAHIGGIFFGFIARLIVYLIYKDRDPFVRRHAGPGAELPDHHCDRSTSSRPADRSSSSASCRDPAVWILSVVFSIMAAMAANKGEEYTYPMVPKMVT